MLMEVVIEGAIKIDEPTSLDDSDCFWLSSWPHKPRIHGPNGRLERFPLKTNVYYEMGPNGPGTIAKAQYLRVWDDDEMRVPLDR